VYAVWLHHSKWIAAAEYVDDDYRDSSNNSKPLPQDDVDDNDNNDW